MSDLELQAPAGFERMPLGLGFADQLQPLYRNLEGGEAILGMRVSKSHINLMGFCHGGVYMTLADIAAVACLHVARDQVSALPTINLSFDFMASSKEGDWIEARPDHIESKRSLGFSSGAIYRGDTLLVRYSGTFYYVDPEKAVTGNTLQTHPLFQS